MAVTTQATKAEGAGNGVATIFPFTPLVIYDTADLTVLLVEDATGIETPLTEGTGSAAYAVVPLTSPIPQIGSTGSIRYPEDEITPMPSGFTLVMKRILTLEQLTVLNNQGGYFPKTQETQFDKIVYMIQQQGEELDRSLKAPLGYLGNATFEIPNPEALRFLRWNATALALENVDIASLGVVVAEDEVPALVSLTTGSAGTDADYARGDHVHEVPVISLAKGGTGSATLLGAQQNLELEKGVDVAGLATANTFTETQQWFKGADVASAAALAVDIAGNEFDVTGAVTITSLNTKGVGTIIVLHFDAALILTHHATDLILPGGANITTAAGDVAVFMEYAAGDWQCVSYSRASGQPVATTYSGLTNIEVFTGDGTWTKPAGINRVKVEVYGPGGGGGGAGSDNANGGGGGGGGYSEKIILDGALGATETVTVGTGGAGATAGNNAGSAGSGSSSFGAHCSASQGTGGGAASGSTYGAGGTGTGGDINLTGGEGDGPDALSGVRPLKGAGGDCAGPRGGSGGSVTKSGSGGRNGKIPGGGGGGGIRSATTSKAGGAGQDGYVIVYEYQ